MFILGPHTQDLNIQLGTYSYIIPYILLILCACFDCYFGMQSVLHCWRICQDVEGKST